jgi:hypothetical protein
MLLATFGFGFSMVPIALSANPANSPTVAGYQFTSFDVPGAFDTIAHHINNGGVITGLWHDLATGDGHGFVRAKDGSITTFDAPGSVYTDPEGINGNGDIVGFYFDAGGVPHGFLRDHKGTISSIDVPFAGAQGTFAFANNSKGTITGWYGDANGNDQPFVRSPDGKFTAVTPPGDVFGALSQSLNNQDAIDGLFVDSNSVLQGFLRQANGSIITFDAPLAGTGNGQGTLPAVVYSTYTHHGLNERGDLTGAAVDSGNTAHGFLRTKDGNFVSFDVPGAGVGNLNGTYPGSINSSGTIAGLYFDNNGVAHGFVRHADGSIVPFDAPGAAAVPGSGTNVFVINDSGAIAGYWGDAAGVAHGFIME